jgi:murein DD-endopeptidase MepM/ murein hydrolase activator NlpD
MPFANPPSISLPFRLPRAPRVRLAAITSAATLLLTAAVAQAAAPYANPFSGLQPYVGRTDMGVDVCLSPGDPIRAVGSGVVTGILRDWSARQPYLWYRLTGGAHAGDYVYVAEQITNLARVGQTLAAGDVIARYAKKGTCIETGWSTGSGATLAQATTGYIEGQVTVAGASFARFLISLGVEGTFDLIPAHTSRVKPVKKHRAK